MNIDWRPLWLVVVACGVCLPVWARDVCVDYQFSCSSWRHEGEAKVSQRVYDCANPKQIATFEYNENEDTVLRYENRVVFAPGSDGRVLDMPAGKPMLCMGKTAGSKDRPNVATPIELRWHVAKLGACASDPDNSTTPAISAWIGGHPVMKDVLMYGCESKKGKTDDKVWWDLKDVDIDVSDDIRLDFYVDRYPNAAASAIRFKFPLTEANKIAPITVDDIAEKRREFREMLKNFGHLPEPR